MLHPDEQVRAFFACWTRKEAYVKARGGGLSIPLDRFEVSLTPEQQSVSFNSYEDESESSRWSMQSFVPWPDCIAALCVEAYRPETDVAVSKPNARKMR